MCIYRRIRRVESMYCCNYLLDIDPLYVTYDIQSAKLHRRRVIFHYNICYLTITQSQNLMYNSIEIY